MSMDQSSAEPIACAICGSWPPADRAWVREWVTVIPSRAEVCEDCMRAFRQGLPWEPPIEH
jgi:hypothetical protein